MSKATEHWSRIEFGRDDVQVVGESLDFDGFFQIYSVNLRHRLFAGGWSKVINRELFKRHDAVGVLLYDPVLDSVALVEQFRIGVLGSAAAEQAGQSPWIWELVAGIIDNGESAMEVARRESKEEAGTVIEQLEPIAQYYASPGGSNEHFHLFAGKADLSQTAGVHGLPAEGEDIRVHVLSVQQCWQKLLNGELNNAHTLVAVQWLKLNHQWLRERWS